MGTSVRDVNPFYVLLSCCVGPISLLATSPRLVFTVTIMAILVSLLTYYSPLWLWACRVLSFAWVPVLTSVVIMLVTVRKVFRAPMVIGKIWLVSGCLVFVSVCILSTVYNSVDEKGFGGEWGRALTPDDMTLGLLVIIAGVFGCLVPFGLLGVVIRAGAFTGKSVTLLHSMINRNPSGDAALYPSDTQYHHDFEDSNMYSETPGCDNRDGVPVWELPSPALLVLSDSTGNADSGYHYIGQQLKDVLAGHGVNVDIVDVTEGPSTVRIGLVPGLVSAVGATGRRDSLLDSTRVKVQSILSREKDIALALRTPNIRIQVPVPGQSWIGVEVPKAFSTKVRIGDVIHAVGPCDIGQTLSLPMIIGMDSENLPCFTDLVDAPHMLIGGSTSSGKSSCVHSMVSSLLMYKTPSQLKFLMIDPKRVEFASYAGIPHLEQPVITDMDHATAALDGLAHDMVDRLSVLSDTNSKDIDGYNKKTGNLMPYVVLVVDELADLMAYGGSKIEASLVRLAQLGRAAGIHLILATQRPSTDVVTGLIKANLPVRIAFKTSSNTDSRVVLGQSGAEKLMGNGDLLFSMGQSSIARRVQGAWVEEEETQLLVEHWKEQSRWNCSVKG